MKRQPYFKEPRIQKIGQGLPLWLQITAQVPFLFLFGAEAVLAGFFKPKKPAIFPCRTVSVVIPTKNEENYIPQCIRSIAESPYLFEIIVVDAGSTDRTRLTANQAGARVMVYDRSYKNGGGRGGQIRAGVRAARGDIVIILHADTRLPAKEIYRILSVLKERPDVVGGAVGCRFDSPQRRYRFLELANDVRAAFFNISFGDQVQFFRRAPVVRKDLYPGIPLMEDIELSLRLRHLGKQVYLFGNARVSVRRWQKKGAHNALLILRLICRYFFQRLWKAPDTAKMYEIYYHLPGC